MIANAQHRILWLPGEERSWDEDGGGRSPAGVRITPENATSVAAVFSCLRILAETVAGLPLHLLERTEGGGKRIARELPLYRRLHSQPNNWQTSFEWREQAVMHVALWGDAFSELVPGASGAIDQIVPLHPSRMKVETLENDRLRYTYREAKGRQTTYTDEQILHLRGPSDDGVHGISIVEECREAIALARACEVHGARFFGAGARPGFILSTENPLNADARRELAENWNRKHRGPHNAHETAVLTGGLKPYEVPYASNNDSQFIELRDHQLREIARLFRIPGYLLGLEAGSPQSEIQFVTHTIMPWLRRFESAFARDLIVEDDRYLAEFDVRGLLRGDAASRSAYYRAMWDIGVVSTNDIRASENLDPVEGGDERYRPLNMGTLGAPPSVDDVLAQQQPGSGIDGQAVAGGLSAAEPVPAETSLTPAEVTSLLTITKQITDGLLTLDAARAIITAAFPVLSAARVETILQGVQAPAPASEQQQPPPEEPSRRDCGTGAGGFQPGNKCGGGDGGGGDSSGGSSSGGSGEGSDSAGGGRGQASAEVKAWAERKFSDPDHAKAFTKWFGDSKVVDEKGEPLVVYHGTGASFDEFKPSEKGMLGPGIYASADKGDYGPYSPYAGKDNAQVMPVYMSIRSPHYAIAGDVKTFDAPPESDGTILIDRRTKKVLWAVARKPTAVKSATGNSGAFDPNDPKITRALARSLPESRALTISIDFDRTFAADPELWGEFAEDAVEEGNTVVMVSRRPDTPEDRQKVTETLGRFASLFSQVLLVGEQLKDEAAKAAGVNVDVWVDDSPQFIRSEQPEADVAMPMEQPADERSTAKPKRKPRKLKADDGSV